MFLCHSASSKLGISRTLENRAIFNMLLRDGYISHIFTLLFGIAVLSSVFAGAQKPGSCLTYQNVLHFLESASLDYFPNRDGDATELFPMSPCGGLVIEEASLDQLQDALHNGSTTSVQLLWCYLERIHQVEEYVTYVHTLLQYRKQTLRRKLTSWST